RKYVNGTTAMADRELAPGQWFWRLRGLTEGRGSDRFSPVWSFTVPAHSSSVVSSWRSIPDLNGDGHADLVVSGPQALTHIGRVSVYFGGTLPIANQPASNVVGLDGPNSMFGYSIANAGDLNGDGYADVIVGAPEAINQSGKIHAFLGSASG